jgi:DNA repair exonuclease SbcCD nuclease subunit
MALYVFGDIHFSIATSFYTRASRDYLAWLSMLATSPEEDEVILLGDIGDVVQLTDEAISFIETLHMILSKKFKFIYIIPGNHDEKIDSSGNSLLSYRYLSLKGNVEIIESPLTHKNIQGINCIFYPYIKGVVNPYERYKELTDNSSETHDIAFGHLTLKEALPMIADSIASSSIKAKYKIFGHIHYSPDHYKIHPGSAFPCAVSEDGENRYYVKIVKKDDIEFEYIKYPIFLQFKDITYPELPLEEDRSKCIAYTVVGNVSELTAYSHYKDYYVYRVRNTLFQQKLFNKKNKTTSLSSINFNMQPLPEMLDLLVTDTKLKISDKGYAFLKEILSDIPTRKRVAIPQ